MASRAFPPASCRSRIRATSSPSCSCPTAPRWCAPRTSSTRCSRSPARRPASTNVITIAGVSALDNNATLANAGVAYLTLKGWSEREKQGPGPAVAVHRAQQEPRRDRGGAHHRDAAAGDPGRRQRRRLHAADRIARRQLRPGEAAERDRHDRGQRQDAVEPADRDGLVPRRGAAIHDRDRPRKDQDRPARRRPGVLGARRLFRLDLCRSVQQVRPRVPGLRAGRRPVPAAAAGRAEPDGPQQGGQHDPARHPAEDHAVRGARR